MNPRFGVQQVHVYSSWDFSWYPPLIYYIGIWRKQDNRTLSSILVNSCKEHSRQLLKSLELSTQTSIYMLMLLRGLFPWRMVKVNIYSGRTVHFTSRFVPEHLRWQCCLYRFKGLNGYKGSNGDWINSGVQTVAISNTSWWQATHRGHLDCNMTWMCFAKDGLWMVSWLAGTLVACSIGTMIFGNERTGKGAFGKYFRTELLLKTMTSLLVTRKGGYWYQWNIMPNRGMEYFSSKFLNVVVHIYLMISWKNINNFNTTWSQWPLDQKRQNVR